MGMINDDTPHQEKPDPMTNEGLAEVMQSIEERRAPIRAATKRISLILDTIPYLLDDKGYVRCINDEHDDAQTFIRDNLDLRGMGICSDWGYEHLTRELAQSILDDLATIWADEYSRDQITEWAISMSLCPMHFCDWAACFDDDDKECSAIRAIYPHSHDT